MWTISTKNRDFSRKKIIFFWIWSNQPVSPSILPFQQSRAAVKWTVVWAEITTRSESDRESKYNFPGICVVEHFLALLGTSPDITPREPNLYLRQSLCFFCEQPSTRGCSKCRNEISFKAVPQEIILKQNRVERLWVFDIFRMAAKFNLKSSGTLGGRRGHRLQSVSQWEGAFVVPLLFTFGIEGCAGFTL